MKIISFNVRGLGSETKHGIISKLVLKYRVDVLCVQETKKEVDMEALYKKLWGGGECECCWALANNVAGGLLCIWDSRKLEVTSQITGQGYLGLVSKWIVTGDLMVIINIYAPSKRQRKKMLWDEILEKKRASPIALWCMVGDFNSIRCLVKRVGQATGLYATTDIEMFNHFIAQMELEDVPLAGRKYTWYKPNGRVKSRIDRVLVLLGWLERWPRVAQLVLNRGISDQCTILMRNREIDWGPKPWRFFNFWLNDSECRELVSRTWADTEVVGWAAFIVKEKLKAIKCQVKNWWGGRNTSIQTTTDVMDEMNAIDRIEETRILSEEELQRRIHLQQTYWEVALKEESQLAQKARVRWMLG
ncbi:uncharacterized protein LOC109815778 [Cajanus cajan]|uniref:uncharacterized protein LOC109815778 n=1 Tax=Cajanus cajan TaxID=3821 RepID=UPI00098DCD18|nr:uncharacterized protein LOC109815778 [Cajanus cajan]